MTRRLLFAVLFLAAATSAQMLHGKVTDISTAERNKYVTNPEGRNGVNVTSRHVVYRIQTADHYYLVEGGRKRELEPGTELAFDVDKGRAILAINGKQKKLKIVGEGLLSK